MDRAGSREDIRPISMPTADTGRPAVVSTRLPEAEDDSNTAWVLVRHAPVKGQSMDSCLPARVARPHAPLGGCPLPLEASASEDAPAATPKATPLFVMTAPSDPLYAPKM